MVRNTIGYNLIYYVWLAYLALFFSSCSVMKSIDKTEIEKHRNKSITLYLNDSSKVKLKSKEYALVDSAGAQWINGVGRINNASVKSPVVINVQDIRKIEYTDTFKQAVGIGITVGSLFLIYELMTNWELIKLGYTFQN